MLRDRSGNALPTVPLAIGGAAMVLGCLFIGVTLYAAVLAPRIAELRATATPTATPTPLTPSPTPTATITPTPLVTNTPTPSPTLTPSNTPPATIRPTNPPPTRTPTPSVTPPPANTPEPPGYGHDLTNISFSTRKQTYASNELIVYDFSITNGGSRGVISYGYLGISVYDAGYNLILFKLSFQGPGGDQLMSMNPGDVLLWSDSVTLSTAGTYNLRLMICWDIPNKCDTPSGYWEALSAYVTITVH